MADRKYPIIFDFIDENIVGRIREIKDAMSETVKKSDETKKAVNDAFKEGAKEAHNYEGAIKDTNEAVDTSNKRAKEQNILLQELGRELKQRLNDVKVFGVGMGDLASRFKNALTGTNDMIKDLKRFKTSLNSTNIALSQGSKAAKGFAAASRLIKVALAGLGIGLVLIALGALVKLLSQSEKITNALSDSMAGLSAAVKASSDFLSHMGKAFIRIINLDYKGYAEESSKAQKAWNEDIVDGFNAAQNYNKVLRETKEVMEDIALNERFNSFRFTVLDDTINDETASYSEKLDAILEKRKELTSELDIAIEAQRKLVDAAVDEADWNEASAKLRELGSQRLIVEIDARNQLRRLDQERLKAAEEYTNEQERQEKLRQKELEDQKKIADTFQEMIDNLNEEMGKLDAKSLSPLEKINEQERIALKELDDRLDVLAEYYLKHYDEILDLTATREEERNKIIKAAAKEREDLINGENEDVEKSEKESLKKRLEELDKFGDDVADEIREMLDLDTVIPEDVFGRLEERFKDFIRNIFKVKPKYVDFFLNRLGTVLNGAINMWQQFTDVRIDENERLLESIRDQKAEYRDLLDQEIEDAAAGYRNDVSNAKERYQEIQEAEKKAIKESEKLKKQQIIIAETTTGIVTALNLAKAASEMAAKSAILGPIAGPIAFGIGMAAILLTFKKIKNQIDSIKLYEGGHILTRDHGFVDRTQGRNDKYQRGHRIEGTNLEVGGGEYVNEQGISGRYGEFLDRLNSGQLNHIDFNKIGRKVIKQHPVYAPNAAHMTKIRSHDYASTATMTKEDMKEVIKELFPDMFDRTAEKISDSVRRKKGLTYKPDGSKVEYDDFRRVEVS